MKSYSSFLATVEKVKKIMIVLCTFEVTMKLLLASIRVQNQANGDNVIGKLSGRMVFASHFRCFEKQSSKWIMNTQLRFAMKVGTELPKKSSINMPALNVEYKYPHFLHGDWWFRIQRAIN